MKFNIKSTLLALAGVGLFANPAMGAINLGPGSLAVAFYQVNGSNVVQPNTFVFDLGNASAYRENSGYNVSVSTVGGVGSSNINTDLVAAFGADWYSSNTVRWMVVGSVDDSIASPVNGDPMRTNYISRSRGNLAVGTTIPTLSATNRGTLNNGIDGFVLATNVTANQSTPLVGANPDGAVIPISVVGSVNDFLPPATTTFFGAGINPYQSFGAGIISGQNVSNGIIEGALDIYRFIDTTTGADLTAPYSKINAAVTPGSSSSGQFIGTLLIDRQGNLSVIPEPSSALLGVFGSLACLLRRKRSSN